MKQQAMVTVWVNKENFFDVRAGRDAIGHHEKSADAPIQLSVPITQVGMDEYNRLYVLTADNDWRDDTPATDTISVAFFLDNWLSSTTC